MPVRFRYLLTAIVLFTGMLVTGILGFPEGYAEDEGLTVSQIMKAIVAPMTNTIWGAYDIQTDAQWQELENAALAVIAAGTLLGETGEDADKADWQEYNQQMLAAARAAIAAIADQDEEALFNAGNDQLYPPCESCHQRFMAQ